MEDIKHDMPLAAAMAPKNLDDFAGQKHVIGPGRMLRRMIESDTIKSAVFFGPPGVGKTALARFIASKTEAVTVELNAAAAGVGDIKKVIEEAKERRNDTFLEKRTLVVLDEIHHFNKTQQDVLLPSVERGDIILIGLTTENPYFYINNALLSRFSVFEFKPLDAKDLEQILKRVLKIKEAKIQKDAKDFFITQANGDARRLLNAVDLAILTTAKDSDGIVNITMDVAKECMQKRHLNYDKKGDEHYDVISAFIKSMRGSDPDAAVYWLARMLESGEDPRFIARRILICASEDVGNAEPAAIMLAEAAFKCAEVLGMPEVRIPLAQAAIYVACAPKSNASYIAVDEALKEVREGIQRRVPAHLRSGFKNEGYKYAHDYPNHYVKQEYMPKPKKFYEPTEIGKEKNIKERLKKLKGEE
ncbi:ATPase family protein [Elusimicrobium minutum Pei191]|uniref:Replication-associated recombination protein A n=1 Tax=Elusimicrobium minutum (strain Pei191) TaxID=445932 RepID=B2KBM0_ELUMP|nr:replication-associated recombination protein A [Elusimicrobium minutum]ACC97707.1 ATPase family protein [Elusimicrobium minutum Pei191]